MNFLIHKLILKQNLEGIFDFKYYILKYNKSIFRYFFIMKNFKNKKTNF